MKAKKITEIFKKYTVVEEMEVEIKEDKFVRERVNKPDAVCAVVYDTIYKKYIFVSQYRPGSDSDMLELVAGQVGKGETPIAAIEREILEEIGYEVDSIRTLVPFYYVSPGYSTERIKIYFAEVSKKVSDGGGLENENEHIIVRVWSEDNIKSAIDRIIDGKTLMGLMACGFKLD